MIVEPHSGKNGIRMFGTLHHHEQNQRVELHRVVAWRQVPDPPRHHMLLVARAAIPLEEQALADRRNQTEAKLERKEVNRRMKRNSTQLDMTKNWLKLLSETLCSEIQMYLGIPLLG